MKGRYLTGLHTLKSEKPYDFTGGLEDTTHIHFHFAEGGKSFANPDRTFDAIVSESDLFAWLVETGKLVDTTPRSKKA